MPKALDTALRKTILDARASGKTLLCICETYGVKYVTVQKLCSRSRKKGESVALKPLYVNCGKNRPDRKFFIYRAVICYKTWHPTWGAEKIRSEMVLLRPELPVPPARTLQKWFHYAGLSKSRSKIPRDKPVWGKRSHEVWQIDAKEEMTTLDGSKNCWLNIKDEKTGMVIEPAVFPLQENLRSAFVRNQGNDDKDF